MASGPQMGDEAPDFELEGTEGTFRLSGHRGERVVLLQGLDSDDRRLGLDFLTVDQLREALAE